MLVALEVEVIAIDRGTALGSFSVCRVVCLKSTRGYERAPFLLG